MFSAQQRDILQETLEWAKYNAGQGGTKSYTDAPKLDQGGWFEFPQDEDGDGSPYWIRLHKAAQIDGPLLEGVPCGTTACVAGYIAYSTRALRRDQSLPGEEIGEYAARVLEMPDYVACWLFDEQRSTAKIITCLAEALEDDHW